MFVKTFKKNYHLQLALLITVPLMLWTPAFINSPALVKTNLDMPIYEVIYNIFFNYRFLSTILAFILVFIQGFILNSIFSSHQLSNKITFLPAFLYIILLSSDYNSMTISPFLILNTFTIGAIYFLFRCYDKKEGSDEVFNTTLFISLATLVYSPLALLMLWVWFTFFIYKTYKWRYWILSILGFITPFIFLGAYYYLTDQLIPKFTFIIDNFIHLPDFFITLKPIQIVFFIGFALLSIISIFTVLIYQNDSNINFRKKTSVLILYFFIALMPCLYSIEHEELIFILAPSLAYIYMSYLFYNRKLIYSNIIFALILLLIAAKVILTVG